MENIQGYVPTLLIDDKKVYVKFGGGRTDNFLEGYCVNEKEVALNMAKGNAMFSNEIPYATPIDENCKIVDKEEQKHITDFFEQLHKNDKYPPTNNNFIFS